jgi:hypothetical protein
MSSAGWQIANNAKNIFRFPFTASLGFDSLYDWYCHTMWVFSGAPDDPEDNTIME